MSSGQDFGANDWLVEEMYERYQQDPSSVPAEWVTYFANNPQAGKPAATPSAGVPPTPKPVVAPNISMPVQAQPNNPVAGVPVQPSTSSVSAVTSATSAPVHTQPVAQAPVATPAPVVAAPVATPTQPVVREVAQTPATPAQAVVKPAPTLATPGAATLEPIRGVGARVVASMEASLSVPTATSVRAIPAKLMIDNRIVINNHLKRGRGGKVSFTHIIAYAMIKALRAMPEMNAFYGELDGKPALGRPEHINLGIAIDLAKPDGTRQLLVPSIKGCEGLDFGQFWAEYEALVKKALLAGTECTVAMTAADAG